MGLQVGRNQDWSGFLKTYPNEQGLLVPEKRLKPAHKLRGNDQKLDQIEKSGILGHLKHAARENKRSPF